MTSYALHFLGPEIPVRPAARTRATAERRASYVADKLLDLSTRSTLLTGLRWRGALLSRRGERDAVPIPLLAGDDASVRQQARPRQARLPSRRDHPSRALQPA